MSFRELKKEITTFKELNFVVNEAIEKFNNGLLSEDEYNRIILNIENQLNAVKKRKNDKSLKDFFYKILNS